MPALAYSFHVTAAALSCPSPCLAGVPVFMFCQACCKKCLSCHKVKCKMSVKNGNENMPMWGSCVFMVGEGPNLLRVRGCVYSKEGPALPACLSSVCPAQCPCGDEVREEWYGMSSMPAAAVGERRRGRATAEGHASRAVPNPVFMPVQPHTGRPPQ